MAEPLWTLGEILSATGGTCLGVGTTPVTGFSIDSRSLVKGEGFVAIRGPNRDGHAFVAAALDAGAACAIAEPTHVVARIPNTAAANKAFFISDSAFCEFRKDTLTDRPSP